MVSDKYLEERKENLLKFILIFFSISGVPIFIAQAMGNSLENAFIQALGLGLTALITIDFFIRKKVFQTTLFMTIFGIVFLSFRYYKYQTYMAPSILWFTCITPSVAWLTGRKIALLTYLATYTSMFISVFFIYKTTNLFPNSVEMVYILGSLFISGYFTYLVSETQNLYSKSIANTLKIEKENIHRNQLYTLGEFAGNIAHEMNNPFQVIKGNAALLSKRLDRLEDDEAHNIKKYAQNIDRTVDRTKKLIDGLLRLSRFPDKEPQLTEFKFQEAWNLAFPLLETKIRNSPAQIKIENDRTLVYGQKDFLAQVLLNLLNNSIYEIQNHENPWITIRVSEAHIDVIDSGKGVTGDVREKVFNPFFSTKSENGTGLGLSLCLNIMNQMKGDLNILEETENTTFRIILPKKESLA